METLLVDIVWQDAEKLLKPACGRRIGVETETATDIHLFARIQVVHPVRYIFARRHVIHGLAERKALTVLDPGVTHVRCNFFGLQAPITCKPTSDVGSHNCFVEHGVL